jgi:hypothetical protein
MTPSFILGRRHGAEKSDDPVLIAGPTYSHVALVAQFKRDFCSVRENPDFADVWLYSGTEEKHVKFSKSGAAPKVEPSKGKKK